MKRTKAPSAVALAAASTTPRSTRSSSSSAKHTPPPNSKPSSSSSSSSSFDEPEASDESQFAAYTAHVLDFSSSAPAPTPSPQLPDDSGSSSSSSASSSAPSSAPSPSLASPKQSSSSHSASSGNISYFLGIWSSVFSRVEAGQDFFSDFTLRVRVVAPGPSSKKASSSGSPPQPAAAAAAAGVDQQQVLSQHTFKCHRTVLSSMSSHFRSLVCQTVPIIASSSSSSSSSSGTPTKLRALVTETQIDIQRIEPFVELLRAMYTGACQFSRCSAWEVFVLAGGFDCPAAQRAAEDQVLKELSWQSTLPVYNAASMLGMHEVCNACLRAVLADPGAFFSRDDFSQLYSAILGRVLRELARLWNQHRVARHRIFQGLQQWLTRSTPQAWSTPQFKIGFSRFATDVLAKDSSSSLAIQCPFDLKTLIREADHLTSSSNENYFHTPPTVSHYRMANASVAAAAAAAADLGEFQGEESISASGHYHPPPHQPHHHHPQRRHVVSASSAASAQHALKHQSPMRSVSPVGPATAVAFKSIGSNNKAVKKAPNVRRKNASAAAAAAAAANKKRATPYARRRRGGKKFEDEEDEDEEDDEEEEDEEEAEEAELCEADEQDEDEDGEAIMAADVNVVPALTLPLRVNPSPVAAAAASAAASSESFAFIRAVAEIGLQNTENFEPRSPVDILSTAAALSEASVVPAPTPTPAAAVAVARPKRKSVSISPPAVTSAASTPRNMHPKKAYFTALPAPITPSPTPTPSFASASSGVSRSNISSSIFSASSPSRFSPYSMKKEQEDEDKYEDDSDDDAADSLAEDKDDERKQQQQQQQQYQQQQQQHQHQAHLQLLQHSLDAMLDAAADSSSPSSIDDRSNVKRSKLSAENLSASSSSHHMMYDRMRQSHALEDEQTALLFAVRSQQQQQHHHMREQREHSFAMPSPLPALSCSVDGSFSSPHPSAILGSSGSSQGRSSAFSSHSSSGMMLAPPNSVASRSSTSSSSLSMCTPSSVYSRSSIGNDSMSSLSFADTPPTPYAFFSPSTSSSSVYCDQTMQRNMMQHNQRNSAGASGGMSGLSMMSMMQQISASGTGSGHDMKQQQQSMSGLGSVNASPRILDASSFLIMEEPTPTPVKGSMITPVVMAPASSSVMQSEPSTPSASGYFFLASSPGLLQSHLLGMKMEGFN